MAKRQEDIGDPRPTKLTDLEKSIIMGTLLGDGHLNKRGNSYRLKIEHSIQQEEYVQWKYEKLKRLCPTTQPPTIRKSKNGCEMVVFYTSGSRLLEEIYNLFYKEETTVTQSKSGEIVKKKRMVKKITKELIDQLPLDPLLLAVWYMDDGSARGDAYSTRIATQGFSLEGNKLLLEYLKTMKIPASIYSHRREKNQYGLAINTASFPDFVKLIEPHVKEIPSMEYKLNEIRREKSLQFQQEQRDQERKPRND